jgi:hypothetical protein
MALGVKTAIAAKLFAPARDFTLVKLRPANCFADNQRSSVSPD